MGFFKAIATFAAGLRATDPRFVSWFGGETDAGEAVSVEMAMQLDVVWACVRRIAETVATLPLHLYGLDKKGVARIDDEHPLYQVLHDSPNYDMTAVNFWECMVGCYLLWGNAFAYKVLGALGRVISLQPMRPDRVQVRRDANGGLSYTYTYQGVTQTFSEDEILHIKGFSLDGLMGMSPIQQARQTLGTARAAQRAAASMFKNGMRPSGFLKAPAYLTPPQREASKLILENFSGASNTGKVPLLEGGWDFTSVSIPPEDAQLLQSQSFHVEQICRWFDMPPILVGHSGQTTWGSGIEQIMLGWLTLGLRSHLKRIEQAIAKDLLSPADRAGGYYAEFNVDALLRADSAARATQMASLAQNGLRTRNELRALDNLPPKTGGDDLTVQSNLLPIDKLGEISRIPKDRIVEPGAAVDPATTGANIPG